jgi:glycerol-3-phosphate O-acyltransferase
VTAFQAAALAALALTGLLLARAWAKGQLRRAAWAVKRQFGEGIHLFKLTHRDTIRRELLADPQLTVAVRTHVTTSGETESRAWEKVHEYLDEIVPSFSLLAYYRLGYGLARVLIQALYKVSIGYEAREALNAIPKSSAVVYLMNHRSNADYVAVAYVLSSEVAISYAVGEWARVWPLETLFKRFGSYFVRRGFREALYHKVLERYIQLITRNGVPQGIFLEGGLTRDGRFREPKLGILDHIVRVKSEPGFDRPLTIIPVAINYDRVLEDRSLLRELQAPEDRPSRLDQVREVLGYVLKVSLRFLRRRARRYGRVCVNFGAPLRVDDWLARNPGVLFLPREERLPRLKGLADEVMGRIGAVMPVTAVALAASALLAECADSVTRERWETLMAELRARMRVGGAHVIGEERPVGEVLERALVMLGMRRVVVEEAGSFRIDRAQDPLLRYYANSIAHFLEDAAS